MVKRINKAKLVKIVLDVLKPHQPSITEFAGYIKKRSGAKSIEISVIERDQETENILIIINGYVDYERLRYCIKEKGAEIHSVDEVIVESALS